MDSTRGTQLGQCSCNTVRATQNNGVNLHILEGRFKKVLLEEKKQVTRILKYLERDPNDIIYWMPNQR